MNAASSVTRFLLGSLLLILSTQAAAVSIRYTASSNRIYIENGGTATLTAIKAAAPSAPLTLVNSSSRIWLLSANIQIEDGSTLELHGSSVGGDVNELRLKSDNSSATNAWVQITADYGNIDIEATKITSWDTASSAPDSEYAGFKRAFMRVRSRLASDGVTPLESRMDVVNSEIAYLGHNAAESYGLVWKVLGSGTGLFDKVQVRGNITGSHIHHNYFGVYTYGHQDGVWRDNEVANNVMYGFDPHDDSDNLLIENNEVHHNGNHGIIASKRCNNVVIRGNRSYANTGNGIMLHRSSDDGLVEDNETFDNSDAGIALFASWRAQVRNNTVRDNASYGIRLSMGAGDNLIEGNQISGSGKYGLYFYRGSDTPEPGDDGRPKRNVFRNNQISGSGADGLKMSDSDDNEFTGNTFNANGSTMNLARSGGTVFANNAVPATQFVSLTGTAEDPGSITFSSQPRIKVGLDDNSTARFEDPDNAIFDPDESLYTTSTPADSSLSLNRTQIGSVSTVWTRDFVARPASANISVLPTLWNIGGDNAKGWKVTSPSSSQSITYIVGNLAPGVSYEVRRGTSLVTTLTATSSGRISFARSTGSTGTVTYSVTPR